MHQTNLSVVAELADTLRRDIALGLLPPGERLNIEALKREYAVSHPSVREALSLLVGEGYVASQEGKGFRVLQSSTQDQRDIAKVRAELECIAVGWSITNTSRSWRADVVAAHYALTEVEAQLADDPVAHVMEWDELNRGFHLALAGNCGSPRMVGLITLQYDLGRRHRLMAHSAGQPALVRTQWSAQSAEEHRMIVDAALKADTDLAQQLLKGHILKHNSIQKGALDDS